MADFSLQDLALALALQAGVHPYGHVGSGSELGVPVDINWRQRGETMPFGLDERKKSEILGGGFALQDRLAPMMGSSGRIANALYKLGYMSGATLPSGTQGDIEDLERTSGNKMVKPLLGASIGADLLQAYKPNDRWNMRFVAPQGAPGLMFDWRF